MFDVGCLMLATMTPELQKQHEYMVAYEMIQNLKEIYEGQARQERYETSKALFQCKMSEGSPVGAYVMKMMGYIQTLEKLGFPLNDELATGVILQSLSNSFKQFFLNFNMNEINKTLPRLLGMLRTAESDLKKNRSKSILMVRDVGALNSFRASKDKFEKHMDDMLDVGCLVLATITLELQKIHEYVVSYEMIQNLKEIFEGKARQ
ncbi:hypothetical protein V6N13_081855 [Hibiscus sabdariffa]